MGIPSLTSKIRLHLVHFSAYFLFTVVSVTDALSSGQTNIFNKSLGMDIFK